MHICTLNNGRGLRFSIYTSVHYKHHHQLFCSVKEQEKQKRRLEGDFKYAVNPVYRSGAYSP